MQDEITTEMFESGQTCLFHMQKIKGLSIQRYVRMRQKSHVLHSIARCDKYF